MSKSWRQHYVGKDGKYPGGSFYAYDDSIDVHDADGKHVVALRKNGAGQMVCASKEHGCEGVHDLSPTKAQVEAIKAKGVWHPIPQEGDENVCESFGYPKKA